MQRRCRLRVESFICELLEAGIPSSSPVSRESLFYQYLDVRLPPKESLNQTTNPMRDSPIDKAEGVLVIDTVVANIRVTYDHNG
jgi:hypothetical protein